MQLADKEAVTRVALAALEGFLATGRRLPVEGAAEPLVSVLLVLHNRAELTLRCLLSLQGAATLLEVVIVDNASSDATAGLLDRLDGPTIARNASNLGFLRAANQAAGLARGELLLFLNNDCELLPGSLAAAVERLRAGDVGAVVGKLVGLDGRLQEAGSIVWRDGSCAGYGRGDPPLAPAYMFERDVDYGSAAFMITPRRLFIDLGGFDEAYAPAYYEDADYGLRLWASGRRVVYEPRAVVLHHEFASAASVEEALGEQVARRSTFQARRRAELDRQPLPDAANRLAARSRPRGLRVLFVDDRVPHAALGQGYPRALEILNGFRRLGHEVTHYPLLYPDESWPGVYASVPRDVEVMLGLGLAGFAGFREQRAGYYDVVIVSRTSTLRALLRQAGPALFGQTPWIYDAEALVARRDADGRHLAGGRSDAAELAVRIAEEVGLAYGARAVTCVSERDAAPFRSAGNEVAIVGHALEALSQSAEGSERSGLLFVGAVTDDSSPNADALAWLITEVLPRLERLRGAPMPLTIAGLNASDRVAGLVGGEIRHVGPVESLAPLYARARVFVAPTRFAAGLPMKVHHAAAHGLPVVTTALIASQLGWRDRTELLVANDAEGFARACVELETDPELWQRLRDAALARVTKDCSRAAFDQGLSEALAIARGKEESRPRPTAPSRSEAVPARAAPPAGLVPAHLPDDRSDRIAQLEAALGAARHDRAALRASLSWRVTAPLRALHAWLRGRG